MRRVKVSSLQPLEEKKTKAQDPWRPLDRKALIQIFRTVSSAVLYS